MSHSLFSNNLPYHEIAASLTYIGSSYAVIRLSTTPLTLKSASAVMNRKTSPYLLHKGYENCSIWSSHHLKAFKSLSNSEMAEKILVRNPHKPTELIEECFERGVRRFVVNTVNEMHKIQKVRFQTYAPLKTPPVKFIWSVEDERETLTTLAQMARHKIHLSGLSFSAETYTKHPLSIDSVTRKVLEMGHKIELVTLSAKQSEYSVLKRKWINKTIDTEQGQVKKILEYYDCSDVFDYVLIARTAGSLRGHSLPPEIRSCIGEETKPVLIRQDDDYIVSRINKFPLEAKQLPEPSNSLLSYLSKTIDES